MWPKDVRATKVFLADGAVAYYLAHSQVGELGRILIQPTGPDECQLTCEIIDYPDGRFEVRKRILDPLERMFALALASWDQPGRRPRSNPAIPKTAK